MKIIISSYYDYIKEEITHEKMIIGFGYEIKSIYKSIRKAIKKGSTNIRSLWTDNARFNPVRTYALYIDEDEYIKILTAEDIVTMLIINGRDLFYK